ncbi:tRNA 2-selenouridine(34) synthase MnmH [Ottowia testudinis]|uniref:tRNA 2-selenouridine(34) synthase MnmH n=1 Tax=Ottowia testudinis TaxID=2816950 RepID=A0A975CDQ8_9BURK|nr:tRNA 2-selenouridine(34) synthase MnmH [Ottowia testudinis]QTD44510.1 tRNA 2-selenouridine(34) synthase MnmH [Ottowia testudinis]
MSVHAIPASEALARLAEFSAVIDARSEGEYAIDRLPGALNWPSLHDEERVQVGTLYKQVSPFEARKLGAALVARNIASHIEREGMDKPKSWRPLLYCWRGGQRSGALALVLGQIGFRVSLIEGGYKAFRAAMLADLPAQAQRLSYRVVCGPTGSGKTRLLHALQGAGAQVLDLEALASHRASVLGLIPGQPQPSQKRFEMLIWEQLRGFDATRPVFVEAESKKVGNCTLPESLIGAMRASDCLRVDLSDDERVALLLEDYPFFVSDPAFFCQRLDTLVALRGHAVIDEWKRLVHAGQTESVVRELLAVHYDPGYAASTRRNFARFGDALSVVLADRSPQTLAQAAVTLIRGQDQRAAADTAAARISG